MEITQQVNFHYEYQLADIHLPDAQIEKMNREYEYAALLWGGVKTLANYQEYTPGYLASCERLNAEIPLLQKKGEEEYRPFWGELTYEYKTLNSKQTSSKIASELSLGQNELIFRELSDLKHFLSKKRSAPYIIRTEFSVSGRGVFICHPEDELDSLITRLEKERRGQALIVSPYLNRTQDFSVILSEDSPDIIYETFVDKRGKFCGVLIDNDKVNNLDKWMSDKDIEIYREIFKRYQKLGAERLQIDSFYYKDGERLRVFHLAEVNARKTMGELAYRLFKRNYSSNSYFCFCLLSQAQKKKKIVAPTQLLVSPETSGHALYISSHNCEDEARSFFNN